ncbi:hypothetical protein [Mycolicibacter engbaekii]|uniref:hypothetical protein n=1 Tax=Mycolicibacter engbaekii TaxID=188915 RepID=UPI0013FD6402|nr:hypothetical protein [Mycolicibacter engbaekii]
MGMAARQERVATAELSAAMEPLAAQQPLAETAAEGATATTPQQRAFPAVTEALVATGATSAMAVLVETAATAL